MEIMMRLPQRQGYIVKMVAHRIVSIRKAISLMNFEISSVPHITQCDDYLRYAFLSLFYLSLTSTTTRTPPNGSY